MTLLAFACLAATGAQAQTITPASFYDDLRRPHRDTEVASHLGQWFGDKALQDGSGVKQQGLYAVWAIRNAIAQKVVIVSDDAVFRVP
ncbi:hypothetical protein ABTK74_19630, partial [Acinetobacter baumannii]